MVQGFAAVLLVCLASVPRDGCTEATALDVRSVVVDSELGCVAGWQELIARADDEARGDDGSTYLKTVCHRVRPQAPDRR